MCNNAAVIYSMHAANLNLIIGKDAENSSIFFIARWWIEEGLRAGMFSMVTMFQESLNSCTNFKVVCISMQICICRTLDSPDFDLKTIDLQRQKILCSHWLKLTSLPSLVACIQFITTSSSIESLNTNFVYLDSLEFNLDKKLQHFECK